MGIKDIFRTTISTFFILFAFFFLLGDSFPYICYSPLYMPESVFQFKKFSVSQDRSAMKVGTDGVLLGAWVMPASAAAILDIGTGTGLIALMLAQKSTAFIDAIDIDRDSCSQAIENVSQSPWPDKIKIVNCPLQEFRPGKRYDLIVSNPPYFIDSFAATDEARNIARSASASLSFAQLVDGVVRLLSASGRFCVILPSKEGLFFRELAEQSGLFCNHITHVKTKMSKPEKRVLMEFGRSGEELIEDELIIHEEKDDRVYTDQYKMLTREYYMGF
jgi:tRNA1Val (adenine37-N6)-methyltransferase